jgi:hypothetical protein
VFESAQPCPQTTGVSAEIPTTSISNGQHKITVTVEDAAGNTSVVYEHTITIANQTTLPTSPVSTPTTASIAPALTAPAAPSRGPTNGDPASESARLAAHWTNTSASRLISSYGHSEQITGELTDSAGTPIAGATIEVSRQPSSLGAVASAMAATQTGSDGIFTIHVSSNASSSIQLAYRSHLGDIQPAASTALSLQVPASLHLTVAPHVTSVGHTIVLTGTLAGPIPPGGKQVIFEARATGGSWLEFHSATARPTGGFRVTHRFALPGPERYEFRAISRYEADFPFLAGTSNVVRVRER